MARFTLRINDDLFNYAQEQAVKENRSINEYFINLVQEQYNQETIESKLDEIKATVVYLHKKNNLYYLQKAVDDKKNMSITGFTRTGKSLLLSKIKSICVDKGFSVVDIKSEEFKVGETLSDSFIRISQEILEFEDGNKPMKIFIDDKKIIDDVNFVEEFTLFMYRLWDKDLSYSFCVVLPVDYIYRSTSSNHRFFDLLNFKILTTINNKDSLRQTNDCIMYSLDEIIYLTCGDK